MGRQAVEIKSDRAKSLVNNKGSVCPQMTNPRFMSSGGSETLQCTFIRCKTALQCDQDQARHFLCKVRRSCPGDTKCKRCFF